MCDIKVPDIGIYLRQLWLEIRCWRRWVILGWVINGCQIAGRHVVWGCRIVWIGEVDDEAAHAHIELARGLRDGLGAGQSGQLTQSVAQDQSTESHADHCLSVGSCLRKAHPLLVEAHPSLNTFIILSIRAAMAVGPEKRQPAMLICGRRTWGRISHWPQK